MESGQNNCFPWILRRFNVRLCRKDKKEKGAVIVEASIALPVFMFAIITILSIVNICYVQAKMQIAVNSTAKEMSQYFYLYGLAGLDDAQQDLHNKTLDADTKITDVLDGSSEFLNAIGSTDKAVKSTVSDPTSAKNNVNTIKDAYRSGKSGVSKVSNTAKEIAADPQSFIMGVAAIVAEGGIEEVKTALAGPIAKMFCEKHLQTSNSSTEQFLKHLKIVPKGGSYYDGIDFSKSRFCVEGTSKIIVVAKYQIHVIDFFGLDIRFNFEQCGETSAWFGSTSAQQEE